MHSVTAETYVILTTLITIFDKLCSFFVLVQ